MSDYACWLLWGFSAGGFSDIDQRELRFTKGTVT